MHVLIRWKNWQTSWDWLPVKNLCLHSRTNVMADRCQGSFSKICMIVLPENHSPRLEYDVNDSDLEAESNFPIKKRILYTEGGRAGKKSKLASVCRLIILCSVPQIIQKYENVKLVFKFINLNGIPFKFISGFKILLIINIIRTATSTYPCPCCFMTIRDMRGR